MLFGIAGALARSCSSGWARTRGTRTGCATAPVARIGAACCRLRLAHEVVRAHLRPRAPPRRRVRVVAVARRGEGIRELAQPLGIGFAVAFVAALVLWPALIVDAAGQFELLESPPTSRVAATKPTSGSITQSPGVEYFAIAMPLRMTPWFLVALLLATIAALASKRSVRAGLVRARGRSADIHRVVGGRLEVRPVRHRVAAVARSSSASASMPWWDGRCAPALSTRRLSAGAIIAVTVMVVVLVHRRTMGARLLQPAVGGGEHGQKTLLVGWGEGLERFGRVIEQRQDGDVTTSSSRRSGCST